MGDFAFGGPGTARPGILPVEAAPPARTDLGFENDAAAMLSLLLAAGALRRLWPLLGVGRGTGGLLARSQPPASAHAVPAWRRQPVAPSLSAALCLLGAAGLFLWEMRPAEAQAEETATVRAATTVWAGLGLVAAVEVGFPGIVAGSGSMLAAALLLVSPTAGRVRRRARWLPPCVGLAGVGVVYLHRAALATPGHGTLRVFLATSPLGGGRGGVGGC